MLKTSPDASEVKDKKIKLEVLQEATSRLYELGVADYIFLDPVGLVEKFFEKGWTFSEVKRGEPIGWWKYPASKKRKSLHGISGGSQFT